MVLSGEVERGVGAVVGQLLNGARACVRDILTAREQEELEARIAALEDDKATSGEMRSMKRRVAVLENERRSEATAANPEAPPEHNELYEMEMGFTAVKLVQGTEPKYTLDEAGTFLTLDGQCALSRHRVDIQALMGPRTKQQQESIPPERWGRLLAADDDAADLLERIIGRAGDAAVPDDYREPNHDWNDLAEVCDQLGQHEFGSVFAGADERETTRRMTWALIHDPGALAMLSELTRRRDAFVAEEGTSNK